MAEPKKSEIELLPITLSPPPPGLWRVAGRNDKGRAYINTMSKIVRKPMGTACAYCGFRTRIPDIEKARDFSGLGLELHCVDGYDDNLDIKNINVACNFCRMCFNLEYAGECGAMLAYIPEFSQAVVNNIVRSCMYLQVYHDNLTMLAKQSVSGNANPNESYQQAANISHANETINRLKGWMGATGIITATIKNRSILAEKLIGTSRPQTLSSALVALNKINDNIIHDETLFASSCLNHEIRTVFSEQLRKNNEQEGPPQPSSPQKAPAPDLESVLHGIRVIPTKPGCDPNKAWYGNAGAFNLQAPITWLTTFQQVMEEMNAMGSQIDMPATNISLVPDEPEEDDAANNGT